MEKPWSECVTTLLKDFDDFPAEYQSNNDPNCSSSKNPKIQQIGNKVQSQSETQVIKKDCYQLKPNRPRTMYTSAQILALEKEFKKDQYLDSDTKKKISESLNITEKQIKIWFQNRRTKERNLKKTGRQNNFELVQDEKNVNLGADQMHHRTPVSWDNYQFGPQSTNYYYYPHYAYGNYNGVPCNYFQGQQYQQYPYERNSSYSGAVLYHEFYPDQQCPQYTCDENYANNEVAPEHNFYQNQQNYQTTLTLPSQNSLELPDEGPVEYCLES